MLFFLSMRGIAAVGEEPPSQRRAPLTKKASRILEKLFLSFCRYPNPIAIGFI
jgi:hypothetical protein